MKAKAVDHICIAVKDLEAAKRAYEDTLGWELAFEYEAPEEKIKVARYYVGGLAMELMEDLDGSGPVARFIERSGEGVYLISYLVDDVAAGLAELKAKGQRTLDKEPRHLFGGQYAFIQPPSRLGGVLTEIIDGDMFKKDKPDK